MAAEEVGRKAFQSLDIFIINTHTLLFTKGPGATEHLRTDLETSYELSALSLPSAPPPTVTVLCLHFALRSPVS